MQMFIDNNDRLVIKTNKKYYPQILLEECKYIQEKIKIVNYIDEDLKIANQMIALMMRLNLTLVMKNNLLKNNIYNIISGSR